MGICNSKKEYELNPPKYNQNQNRWGNRKKNLTPTKADINKAAINKEPEVVQTLLPLTNKKLQSKSYPKVGEAYCSTYKVAQASRTDKQKVQGLINIKGNILQSRKGGKKDQHQVGLSVCSKTLNGAANIISYFNQGEIKQYPNRNEKDNESNRCPPQLIMIKDKLESTDQKMNVQFKYQR